MGSANSEMANPDNQDDQDHSSQMNEYAGKITTDLTRTVDAWGREMSRLKAENARLSAELRDLKHRTASVASERAVRDESLEDVTVKNRPSQIRISYQEFIDGDRMDAVDALDKVFPQDKSHANPRLACEIFEVAFRVATVAISSLHEHLQRTLLNPTAIRTSQLKPQQKQHGDKDIIEMYLKYSTTPKSETHRSDADIKSITDSISAYLIRTSNSVDTRDLKEDVASELAGMYQADKKAQEVLLKKLSLVEDFISDCCKLAWQLVVQDPSMHIEYVEEKFDQTKHEPANRPSTSKPTAGKRIRYYLWPTLLSKKDGTVLCKGVVVTGNKHSEV